MHLFSERGSFLALDLGGTNFRVLLITLKDSEHVEMKNKIYPISQATMTGHGSQVTKMHSACVVIYCIQFKKVL